VADESELGADLGDEDLGEPIAELRTLDEPAPDGFLNRLLASLRRRDLSSHFATFSWSAMGTVVIEFVRMIYSLFESGRDRGDAD
jgi:hypothetical protein